MIHPLFLTFTIVLFVAINVFTIVWFGRQINKTHRRLETKYNGELRRSQNTAKQYTQMYNESRGRESSCIAIMLNAITTYQRYRNLPNPANVRRGEWQVPDFGQPLEECLPVDSGPIIPKDITIEHLQRKPFVWDGRPFYVWNTCGHRPSPDNIEYTVEGRY